jgi:hypothetical protein
MRAIRILLILFMSFWIIIMAGCPGLYDSRLMALAVQHYNDARTDASRHELDEARRLDRRDILIYEMIMAGVLGAAIYGFIRIGRR